MKCVSLASLWKKKTQINKIRKEREEIATDATEILTIIREYEILLEISRIQY